ncbi:MAG: flavodoxin domain-containing protein [Lachnospiraceae bacterium]
MKKIVVYQSGTGFTSKYAGWIAEDLGCNAVELKSTNLNELGSYDMVIYGGWIMGGMVTGYDKVKKLELKNIVVFAVGMTVPSEEVAAKIAEQNQIPREQFFYFEGGYNPQKLGFVQKMMMNMIKKSLLKKADKTAEELHTLETFKGADNTDRNAIKGLVEYCETKME